jgi:hypothetical protein
VRHTIFDTVERIMSAKLVSTYRKAFVKGFWRGLASPAWAFVEPATRTQGVFMTVNPPAVPESPMRAAWAHVGSALTEAIEQHEQTTDKPAGQQASVTRTRRTC